MKLTIPRSDLKTAITGLSRVVTRRSTLPVLGGIHIEMRAGQAILSATDLDQYAQYLVAGPGVAGSVVVPLEHLKALTSGPAADPIEIESLPSGLALTAPVSGHPIRRVIPAIDPAEWPSMPALPPLKDADAGFLAAYQRAVPFASTDESRYILNSVCVESGKDGAHVVATDGRRMTTLNGLSLPLKGTLVIPTTKFLLHLRAEGGLKLGASEDKEPRWFSLQAGPWTYSVHCREGTYPNWRQVVPASDGHHTFRFPAAITDFLAPVMAGFVDEPNHGIQITGQADGGVVVTGRTSLEAKPSHVRVPDATYKGIGLAVGVNRDFLLDMLRAGFRSFACTDSESPLVAREEGALHVLMPIRILDASATPSRNLADSAHSANLADANEADAPAANAVDAPTPSPTQPKKEERMKHPENPDTKTALDRLVEAYELARAKVRESQEALAAVAGAIKEAVREDKARRSEIEGVRAGLAKLKTIQV